MFLHQIYCIFCIYSVFELTCKHGHRHLWRSSLLAFGSNREGIYKEGGRARPDWVYEFPGRTGPDIQICWTGPAGVNLDLYC